MKDIEVALLIILWIAILFTIGMCLSNNVCAGNYGNDDITVNVYHTEQIHTTEVIQNFDYRGTAMGLASDHSYQIDTGAVQSDFVCSTYEGVKACSFGTAKSFDNKYMIKGSIVKSGSKDAATIGVGWRW
jgi:hypothetical protein